MNNLFDPVNENDVDFEKDKRVDVHDLHNEWLQQPDLIAKYIKLMAQAERDRDRVKERIEVCKTNLTEAKAGLELAIRNVPEKYGLKEGTKPTEAWFSNTVIVCLPEDPVIVKIQEEFSKSQSELIEANYRIGIYNAGVKAMQDRKATLEHEVFLWAKGYFSVPNLPKPLLEEYQEPQKGERDERTGAVRQAIQPVEWKEISSSSQRRRRS